MSTQKNVISSIDGLTVFLYLIILGFGIFMIFTVDYNATEYFVDNKAFKQLLWAGLSLPIIALVMSMKSNFYNNYAGICYIISLLLLAGLFVFGTERNGAWAWYTLGPVSLQPTEFAKLGTALIIANYLATPKLKFNEPKTLFVAVLYMSLPLGLIILQPDMGSVLVFSGFFAGLLVYQVFFAKPLVIMGLIASMFFIIGITNTDKINFLLANPIGLLGALSLCILLIHLIIRKLFKKRNREYYVLAIGALILSVGIILGSHIIFQKMRQHQQDRINLLFEDVTQPQYRRSIGYNLYTAKSAIASGELYGKGINRGDITGGDIVPEQETDYIFTAIGEQTGFIGSVLFIIVYGLFLLRLFKLASRQRLVFSGYFIYSVAAIFSIHFVINLAMVMGMFPTIGIPLPFVSYGGSSLWSFTIMLFISLRLDADRKDVTRNLL